MVILFIIIIIIIIINIIAVKPRSAGRSFLNVKIREND